MKADAWDTAMERAAALRNAVVWQSNGANIIIAKALIEAEERGRKVGLEVATQLIEAFPKYKSPATMADTIRAKADEVQK